ncbi:MAG: hypothetical protein SNJ82_14345 [Gemmataceae bacterium]
MADATKVSSRGIYQRTGDGVVICLGNPDATERPTDFAVGKGSQAVLLSLSRVLPSEAKPPLPPVTSEISPVPAVKQPEETLRKQRIGTSALGAIRTTTLATTTHLTPTGASVHAQITKDDYGICSLITCVHTKLEARRASGDYHFPPRPIRVCGGQIFPICIIHIGPYDLVLINSEGKAKRQ